MSRASVPDENVLDFDPFAGSAISLTVPSTDAQREVWTATRMSDDGSLAFNESVAISLRGPLDTAALGAALGALVRRHESLRATFSPDGLTMLVGEPADVPLAVHDWSAQGRTAGTTELTALLRRVVAEPFDLARGPLLRADLARLADTEHVLVLTAHHIVCDGWSFGVIARELASLYSAEVTGAAPALAPADEFSAYAHTLCAEATGEDMAESERYWIRQFAGEVPVLDLPTDRPRPALKTYAAAREDRLLPSSLMRRVTQAGARERASAFTTLLGTFAALVHRLSGQDDLVIGIPVAGQARAGARSLVGHCVNMLPLRLRVDPSLPFSELLAHAKSTVLDAMEYQQITLGQLLVHLPIARDPSRLPLVSVIFNVDRGLTPDAMPFAGLEAELEAVPRSRESFDLFLNAVELHDGAMRLECQYNTDLYDRETIARWLESYEQLLDAAAADGAQAVAALPILTATDRAAIARCNDTARPLPAQATVAAAIEAQARRSPDAVALEHDGVRLTYRELDERSGRMAAHLRALGVRRDELVGLCLDRSIDMIVSLVAVLRAGGGYLPLDPAYPRDRLAYMMEDARARVLITDSRLRGELALDAAQLVLVDEPAADTHASPPAIDDADAASAESTAYVIYTSGSTGKPKGVVVTNGSVVNLLESVRDTYRVTERDRVLAITTLSFDIAVSEILLPLVAGARIVLASRDVASDGLRLARLIEESGVTFIDATPATYRLLLAAGWTGGAQLRVVCTGEAMPLDVARALTACASRVWNGYGPTETTVWSTIHEVRAPVQRVLIGRPVANTVVHVLDARMQPVPVGVKGELYIAGAGVARGYLNRPELTRDRFLADPFSDGPDRRMYRTGDVVRLLADGALECLGRIDNQVKVRGFRIELGEIENGLLQHEGVAQASVTVREDRPGDVRLVAYLVATASPPTDATLRSFLKQRLPDYMVPQRYTWLPTLPLTPSGKVDRKALPAPADAPRSDAGDFVEPRTETERLLGALWSEVLGVGRVSVHDDFFALGGHSLLASQLLARLRRDHAIELPFRRIFEMPTIAQLAQHLDAAEGDERSAPPAPIPHDASRTTAPLSLLQERLWMQEEMDPTQRVAHMHGAAWRLRGALDAARLESAISRFIHRHATLRTSFHVMDGIAVQAVAPTSSFTLGHRDLSAVPAGERQAALDALFDAEQAAPFDLAQAPLFRAVLIRLANDEHLLFTVRHGMIWDGWSFDIFIREIVEAYDASAAGREPALPALPITYADFAAWQREWMDGPEMARQVAFWREQLAGGVPAVELPTDHPRVTRSAHRGGRVAQRFTRGELDQLKTFAREHDATLFMLMFSAYVALLHRYTGQHDLVVGSPVQARTRTETENVVGAFVNTVLLRVHLTPDTPLRDLLRQVREVTLGSFSHQEMPFELLGSQVPTVRVLFSMQDARSRPSQMGDVRVEQVHLNERTATNDLMLWMMERDDQLLAVLNYDAELFEAETAARILPQLRTLVFGMLHDDAQRIGDLRILPDEELARILAPAPARAPASTAAEQFERAAARTPDAIALVHGREPVTYGALLRATDAVRSALHSLALPAGARIAVAIGGEGTARVTAVLGALRAGCSVRLVDPESPQQVVAARLRAANAAVVITDDAGADALPASAEIALLVLHPDSRTETHRGELARAPHVRGVDPDMGSLLDDVRSRIGLSAADVVMSGLPTWADAALLQMLLPLTTGARLVLASDDMLAEPESLAELLASTAATTMIAPLATWRALAAAGFTGTPSFTALVVGAPVADRELAGLTSRVGRVFTASDLAGTGGWACMHEVRSPEPFAMLGTPVGDAQLVVLDDRHAPQPIGVDGALYVGGTLTGGARAPQVRAPLVGSRPLVATGMRARRRGDGAFVFREGDPTWGWVGGALVPLALIEEALRADAGVADAAVASHRDASGEARLVAYVVHRPGAAGGDTALRVALRRQLPGHMIPQVFVESDRIPRDVQGAVERARLRSPFATEASVGQVTEPRTESERRLASTWKEALAIPSVSVHDNFFDLGGSSLLCFRVIEAVHGATGVRLSPRTFLLGTFEQVAAQLHEAMGAGQGAAAAAAVPSEMAPAPAGVVGRLKGLMGFGR